MTAGHAQPGDNPPLADVLRMAAQAWQAVQQGTALERALAAALQAGRGATHPRLAAAARDVTASALRELALVEAAIDRLATRPPAVPVRALLAVALALLLTRRYDDYVLVDQAVTAAKADAELRPASGFVNAILRQAVRSRATLVGELEAADERVAFNAPAWWIAAVRRAHPEQWREILRAQRAAPPLTLRVNARRLTVSDYLARCAREGDAAQQVGEAAVWLQAARPVERVAGFAAGEVSVQDAGSQLAAAWLQAEDGMRVLDACAAPGGKTGHLLERARLSLDAVELDAARAARIDSNLARLGLAAPDAVRVVVADAARPGDWARAPYDRILLDAPCTASGIVRRHPDILWLRRVADVAQLATAQARLLEALWPLLGPAGRLLYVVCSVFPEEGERVIQQFVARHPDARERLLPGQQVARLQLLPSSMPPAPWSQGLPTLHDGFYYALLEKK